jgi:hypothetical protein
LKCRLSQALQRCDMGPSPENFFALNTSSMYPCSLPVMVGTLKGIRGDVAELMAI